MRTSPALSSLIYGLLLGAALTACQEDEDVCGARPVAGSAPGALRPGPCEIFYDVDGDDEIDTREVYRYDDQDREIERYTYYDGPQCNSAVLHSSEYEGATRLRMLRDTEVDGIIDSTTTYSYDEAARLIGFEETRLDAEGEVKISGRGELIYDDAGRLASESLRRGTDNVRIQRARYTYDEAGLLTEIQRDGATNTVERLSYNEGGLLATKQIQYTDDTRPDEEASYFHDDAGNLLRVSIRSVDTDLKVYGVIYDYGCW